MRLVILFLLGTIHGNVLDQQLIDACPPVNDKMDLLIYKGTSINCNLKERYAAIKGKPIGEGAFAEVQRMDLSEFTVQFKGKSHQLRKYAVKSEFLLNVDNPKFKIQKNLVEKKILDLEIISKLTQDEIDNVTPSTIACQTETKEIEGEIFVTRVYTVLSLMDYDMFDKRAVELITNKSPKEKMVLFKHLNGMLKKIYDIGYFHSDVKPENIMIRDGKFYMIDFNGASRRTEEGGKERYKKGTPFYMSPFVIQEVGFFEQRDDLYSLVIGFLESVCDTCYKELFQVDGFVKDNNHCILKATRADGSCRGRMIFNTIHIAKRVGLGDFSFHIENHTPDRINFTELLAHLIIFNAHNYTYEEIDLILGRLIKGDRGNRIPDSDGMLIKEKVIAFIPQLVKNLDKIQSTIMVKNERLLLSKVNQIVENAGSVERILKDENINDKIMLSTFTSKKTKNDQKMLKKDESFEEEKNKSKDCTGVWCFGRNFFGRMLGSNNILTLEKETEEIHNFGNQKLKTSNNIESIKDEIVRI